MQLWKKKESLWSIGRILWSWGNNPLRRVSAWQLLIKVFNDCAQSQQVCWNSWSRLYSYLAGLLAIPVTSDGLIILFRPEVASFVFLCLNDIYSTKLSTTIRWGGDPNAPARINRDTVTQWANFILNSRCSDGWKHHAPSWFFWDIFRFDKASVRFLVPWCKRLTSTRCNPWLKWEIDNALGISENLVDESGMFLRSGFRTWAAGQWHHQICGYRWGSWRRIAINLWHGHVAGPIECPSTPQLGADAGHLFLACHDGDHWRALRQTQHDKEAVVSEMR